MYLSKLKIVGFKSFAYKTNLDFNEGLSCIIGPNGSGKSNIVDAVRWVLGEQRTTALRSDKMENVLFNGTGKRKPTGFAEVSMMIDNNRQVLKSEFDQVQITRRLYRSGESQYLINNNPVRLKDILDTFMDTGLGANSYSVIELKMVESILSENKAERRLLLEEAAGVVKYKIRRKSALRKLDAARSDLIRLNDIISEVQKTVNSLSRQVGKARRYLAYNEDLKKTDVDLSRYRYNRLLDEIRPLKVQLAEVSRQKEASHHQITIDEALLEDYKRELIQSEQRLQELNLSISEIDSKIAEISRTQAVADTKGEESVKNKERYQNDISEFSQKIELINNQLATYDEELSILDTEKEKLNNIYIEIEKEKSEASNTLHNEKTEIDQLNHHFRSNLNQLSLKKEELRQQNYQLDFNNEQLKEISEKIKLYALAEKDQNEAKEQIAQKKQLLTKAETKLVKNIETLNDTSDQALSELETAITEKNKNLAELETFRSRKQFFDQIISNYEGHSKSTQFVMNRKGRLKGIHGTIADVLSVDEKTALAVEVILGDALNFVLVDCLDDAKSVIHMVKEERKGRITLVPMDQVNQIEQPVLPEADVDFLLNHIEADAKYETLFKLLLGNVALCSTLDEAVELSSRYPFLRFITNNGETVNFNREIAGGSTGDKPASVIGRKDQLKKYVGLISQAETSLEELETQIYHIHKAQEKRKASLETLEREQTSTRNQLIELDKQEHQLLYEAGKLDETRSGDVLKQNQLEKSITKLSSQVDSLTVTVGKEQQTLNTIEKETILRTNEYETKSESVQLLIEDEQKARLDLTNVQNQYQNKSSDVNRAKSSIADLEKNIERRGQEIQEIERFVIQLKTETGQRENSKIEIWERRDKIEADKGKTEQTFQETRDRIYDLEEATKNQRRQHDSSMETSRTLEIKINENQVRAEQIREFALKEYTQDVEIGIPFEDFNEQEAEDHLEDIRQRIKNLGPVNPLAVSEYDKEKERLDFLSQQRDDIQEAEASLLETIAKINKTARGQFVETFNAIKENFERVFKSFFENGEGTIMLDENDDPLEADIDIQVRTKGKRLQTLSLLSGGEKTLTAISLLFAIYLVKPSPFCILDEVDAPLDDVNVGRFTKALADFSKNTQFIVVTHNKRTMEAASTMYGVTMEEEGVSKIVSVKFS